MCRGTRNVIEACLHNNVRRMLYFGSIHAYQQSPFDQPLDEDRPLLTGEHIPPYERSKALAEMEARPGSRAWAGYGYFDPQCHRWAFRLPPLLFWSGTATACQGYASRRWCAAATIGWMCAM